MALPIYRLRRLLAATAIVLTAVVVGMYFYARMRVRDVLKEVPNKLGYDVRQTANGFQISKSDGKRTLFTVQASKVKQFKLNGNAELHNVNIVLYGRDSSRFDQIYGDDFSFDQKSGDITAKGEVQIDLVANPEGAVSPDQSAPKEMKNPIHLKTQDLVFNKDTGNAATDARVDFSAPQASGWAVGVRYVGKSNTLTLLSQVHIAMNGPNGGVIEAERGVVTNDPRVIVLEHPRLDRESETMQADQASFYLDANDNVQRIVASNHVTAETRPAKKAEVKKAEAKNAEVKTAEVKTDKEAANQGSNKGSAPGPEPIRSRADQAEFLFTGQNLLRTGILTGHVHVEQAGPQPMQGDAGRVILDFAGDNELQKVHALDGARLVQMGSQAGAHPAGRQAAQEAAAARNSGIASGPQDFELAASAIDFTIGAESVLQRAVTSGAAQITIWPASESGVHESPAVEPGAAVAVAERTVVTAGKFDAQFAMVDGKNQITKMHGAPDARIVNSSPGEPDRVSTSESVEALFQPQGGIESLTQQGDVVYTDNQSPDKRMQAWANTARYTPADQLLVLTGNPRVTNGGMATTAKTVHINRATGDAVAEGDVKTTYSDLKEQPDGALLASSSPIHVTSRTMTAHHDSGIALYTGNARLWQDANIIEAPSITFDRDRRFVTAQGTAAQPAQTVLVQKEKAQPDQSQVEKTSAGSKGPPKSPTQPKGAGAQGVKADPLGGSSPIAITALKLTYADSERKVHYEGGVFAKGEDFTAKARTADAYLVPRSQSSGNQAFAGPGQLDHMVALGDVVITQPSRHADGQKLVYTAADDKFVLTGGRGSELPSIFDAEQGKITGVSLTFFRTDDRVLVEGEASTPVVTQTRVAH
ncbi:MAG TPA: LptA/OstA family protein [Terriglobales bacterium]|nr:LptA/OstA family protein [Terriglobales bacterium]